LKNVLVVEDDTAMATALRDGLEYEGYAVSLANDGEAGLQMASEFPPDLILVDVMLPKISGLSLCRELRNRGRDVPIIMLTARGQELDKVQGLKAGADDYLTKPFGFLELTARMEAVLRRSGAIEERKYGFGPITIDFRRREAEREGERVPLSAREFELLAYLIEHRGEVLTRQQLLEAVWGYHGGSNTRTVDMHVAKLRKKLEEDPARPLWIITQHRVGYRFDG
jgi:two-component system alkaline phosphatase synthesis response regulator PhoP